MYERPRCCQKSPEKSLHGADRWRLFAERATQAPAAGWLSALEKFDSCGRRSGAGAARHDEVNKHGRYTHIDLDPVKIEDGGARLLGWHVPIELVRAAVPLDGVERVAFEREDALEQHAVARQCRRWHFHLQYLQSVHRQCWIQREKRALALLFTPLIFHAHFCFRQSITDKRYLCCVRSYPDKCIKGKQMMGATLYRVSRMQTIVGALFNHQF